MNRNINIGIDLGTTNSEVAINNNGSIEIIKNIYGDEYTPSVFGIDKSNNGIVGKRAYEKLYKDITIEESENNKAEVKRLMGTSEVVHFKRNNSKLNAEEISAEILKSLKGDILRKYPNHDTISAVITVPAYFSILQSEATKRAGNLAGFKHVVLLPEPVAAAISYGFMNAQNENWLIYDLGGGTFDVALVSVRDGALSVLSHNGDNFLGGKDIDLAIVDDIIVPKILEKYFLTNFNRGNEQYKSIFSKLKYIAETTKIFLSQCETTLIEIDSIGKDINNNEIYLSFNFSRNELHNLIKPLIDRTIELSKQVISEAGVSASSIQKIVLVGGPTQIPYIKSRLSTDLKIEVDTSADPLTAVACGAAIFAIGQKIPQEFVEDLKSNLDGNVCTLDLNYVALTSDLEEPISGVVREYENLDDELYLQIQAENGTYCSSKLKLNKGRFFVNVVLSEHKTTKFWIYLFDKEGNVIPINQDSFMITHGISVSGAPLPHSIGIAVSKHDINSSSRIEVFEKIFTKGSHLPLKRTEQFKTARALSKNEKSNTLWIRIGEGESNIPDRNIFICELGIKGDDLPFDLPKGSDIDITIGINESRELTVSAYVSLIGLSLNARTTIRDENLDVQKVKDELNEQINRADAIDCSMEDKQRITSCISTISNSLDNAHLDEDEKRKANKQLKDLKVALDGLEQSTEMSDLVREFNYEIKNAQEAIEEQDSKEDVELSLKRLHRMKTEGEIAIAAQDKVLLKSIINQIQNLISSAIGSNIDTWIYWFNNLIKDQHIFTNQEEAKYQIEKGKNAIISRDMNILKRCVNALNTLLPVKQQETTEKITSGISR